MDDGYKWRVLFSVIFGTFMSILDNTVVNVALATLQKDFHASISHTQGVVTYYALSLGIIIPVAGFLADRFGIKRIYVISLVAFTTASALCGLAPSLNALIFFRILQGLGGGALLPLGTAMLFTAFPPTRARTGAQCLRYPLARRARARPDARRLSCPVCRLALHLLHQPAHRHCRRADRLPQSARAQERDARALRSAGLRPFDHRLRCPALWAVQCGDRWLDEQHGHRVPRLGIVALAAFVVVELRSPHPLLNVRFYQKPIYLAGERGRLGLGRRALRCDIPSAALFPDTSRADALPDRACCCCRRRWRRSSRFSSAAGSTTGSARAMS